MVNAPDWRARAIAVVALLLFASPAAAESLVEALASAYANNPTLNSARAGLRATDEGVPQALSGYRPSLTAAGSLAISSAHSSASPWSTSYPRGVSLTLEQPIFDGFRTKNSVQMAETAVLAGRELLIDTEQQVLLLGVQAYMAVLQTQAILNLRQQNLDFLREQSRAAEDRLNVGEGTKTDVAQTQASVSGGISDYNAALAAVNSAVATYEQIIGHRPKSLGAVKSVDGLLPRSLDAAVATALSAHPEVLAAGYNIDVAEYNVKVLEGAFLPSVSLEVSVSHGDANGGSGSWGDSAELLGKLSVPLYQAGLPDSKVRQAKETLGQRRNDLDAARDSARQAAIAAWGTLNAARAQITAAQDQVSAEELVLSGVIEQRKVGQQTTLDVLNAQQARLNAKVTLISAQTTRVVAAYTLLSTVGRLTADTLGLAVARYEAVHHYQQVRDKWGGLRTPDGR